MSTLAEWYPLIKVIHIISSTVLFGGGMLIAFFMWWANQFGSLADKYSATKIVVIADLLFTSPAVIIQPISGFLLIKILGFDLFAPWLVSSYLLYIFVGLCWLPVVAIQIRLRNLLKHAVNTLEPLPASYLPLYRLWVFLGCLAFPAMIAIFWLMVTKPAF